MQAGLIANQEVIRNGGLQCEDLQSFAGLSGGQVETRGRIEACPGLEGRVYPEEGGEDRGKVGSSLLGKQQQGLGQCRPWLLVVGSLVWNPK